MVQQSQQYIHIFSLFPLTLYHITSLTFNQTTFLAFQDRSHTHTDVQVHIVLGTVQKGIIIDVDLYESCSRGSTRLVCFNVCVIPKDERSIIIFVWALPTIITHVHIYLPTCSCIHHQIGEVGVSLAIPLNVVTNIRCASHTYLE